MSEQLPDLNLNLQNLSLTQLTVSENIHNVDPLRQNKIELVEFSESDGSFVLKYTDKLIHHVQIDLELTAVMDTDGKVDKEMIESIIQSEKAEDLALPILNEASHIISFITSKTDFMPMIVPPIFGDFDEENDEEEI